MHHAAGGEQVEQVGPPGQRGDREPVGDRLAEGGEIGGDPEALLRSARGEAEPGDDLVEDQHRTVPGARFAGSLEVAGPRADRARIAHGRFHDHPGDVALCETAFQPIQVVPGHHLNSVGRRGILAGAARYGCGAVLGARRVQAGAVDHRMLSNQP